jgi:hypothetical protein
MTGEFYSLPPSPNYKADVYKIIERPTVGYPSVDLALWAEEYRGFQVCRENDHNTLYMIKTLDGSPTPIKLQGSFTAKNRGKKQIDDYLKVLLRENE